MQGKCRLPLVIDIFKHAKRHLTDFIGEMSFSHEPEGTFDAVDCVIPPIEGNDLEGVMTYR